MSDLISRQAARDVLHGYFDGALETDTICPKDIYNLLEIIPSVQPEQRWIPVGERLPENGHYYLWCSDMGHVQSDYYWNGFENGMKYGYNVVAWMPLPEPYRKDGESDR